MNVRNDVHAKENKRILAGDEVCLLRGKITYDARDIFWLTVVSDGSHDDGLSATYGYN